MSHKYWFWRKPEPYPFIYKPEKFIIQELVDEETFRDRREKGFDLFDHRILYSIDRIRLRYDLKTFVNTWCFGGDLSYRGFRPFTYKYGAVYSQHRCGRAIDFNIEGIEPEDIRRDIVNNSDDEDFKYITTLEKGTNTWVHMDCRPIDNRIILVDG